VALKFAAPATAVHIAVHATVLIAAILSTSTAIPVSETVKVA